MCYYSSISVNFKIIETRFGAQFVQSELFKPVYSASAFTFPLMPVITGENTDRIVLLQWGLIPFWVKNDESAQQIKRQTINARAETVFTKPAFRAAAASRRCLVLVDGFFEWRLLNNQRYPYYIRLIDHQPFALAGIWEKWHNPDTGREFRTFSVITTKANPLLEQIHNIKKRMPVILTRESETRWISSSEDKKSLEALLKPYDPAQMEAYTVDKSVTRLGFNTEYPAILNKKQYSAVPDLTWI
jgi:putative SOS response-associated peptidase YedK